MADLPAGISRERTGVHTKRCWLCGWWFVKGYTAHACSGINGSNAYVDSRGNAVSPINNRITPNNPERGFEEWEAHGGTDTE